MTLRDAITAFLRQQDDRTNLIELLWRLFAGAVKIPPGGTQWIESRRCFFAGALTLFEAVMMILEPGAEPIEQDLARMDALAKELERFREDLQGGRA